MIDLERIADKALRKAGYPPAKQRSLARTSLVPDLWNGDAMIEWIEKEFYIPERIGVTDAVGQPDMGMKLGEYQKAVLREACRLDSASRFVYDLVLWSDIKKSAKSTIAAAVTLYRALTAPFFSAKIVANDLKQANSRVFGYIIRAIALNPSLAGRCTVRNYHIAIDNNSTIEAIPVDPKGEAGGNDDFIEFTELHAAYSKKHQQMWTEMTLSPTKRGFSQRWIDTYAGFAGESPVLEPLYETTVKGGKVVDVGIPGLELYSNESTLALWNTKPRLSWQSKDYYASEAKTLLSSEFNRVHKNEWTSSEDVFVPAEWWESCRGIPPVLDRFREVVVGIDAAVSGDCFGIVAVSREGDKVVPRFIRKWIPPKGGKFEYSNIDDVYDDEYPEGVLRKLAREYNVIAFGYDEYQLHHLCTSLKNDSVGYFVPFNQQGNRLKADKQLRDLIRDRLIIHDGNSDLTEHITNANAATVGDKLRIVKRSPKLKIDLAVCTSMAADLALEYLAE